jgi:hypothetical protein
MQRFEDELRQVLSRPAPPSGFAERVRARIGEVRPRRAQARTWRRLAAAAALLLVIGGGVRYWQLQREQARRQADTARLVWALDLTGRKVRGIERTMFEKRWAKAFVTPQQD